VNLLIIRRHRCATSSLAAPNSTNPGTT
jgi:hypothetical protein